MLVELSSLHPLLVYAQESPIRSGGLVDKISQQGFLSQRMLKGKA
jgi:hypothetical protein